MRARNGVQQGMLVPSVSSRYSLAALTSLAYGAIALWALWNGHPSEDAFIAYTYAKNLANGQGIVFFPGGPPSEGATDFLWLVLLAGLTRLGLYVPIAALVLNVVGAFVVASLIVKHATRGESERLEMTLAAGVLVVLLISPVAAAGYAGFSTFFYSAIGLMLLDCFVDARPHRVALVPVLSFVLTLTRPDGAVVGLAFTLFGAFRAKALDGLKSYAISASSAGLAGLAYYIWRYRYFGLPLPLPLYVKGEFAAKLPGLDGSIHWIVACMVPLAAIVLSLPNLLRRPYRLYLVGLVPFGALLAGLLFVDHVTDVDLRYQAPATIALLLVFAVSIRRWLEHSQRRAMFGFAALATALMGLTFWPNFVYGIENVTEDDYLNILPSQLSDVIGPDTRIVLNTAGRIGYWTNSPTFDIIGLTTADFTRRAVTLRDLQHLRPAIVMIHTAGTLLPVRLPDDGFVKLGWAQLSQLLRPRLRDLKSGHGDRKLEGLMAVYRYLKLRQQDYAFYLVYAPRNYPHLYAIERNSIAEEKFEAKLRRSISVLRGTSYMELRMQPNALPPATAGTSGAKR